MTDPSKLAANAVARLAGISDNPPHRARWLLEHEILEIAGRVHQARIKAGLSARAFAVMDRAAVNAFATRFKFTRAEVRLAMALVKFMHQSRRIYRLSGFIGAQRQRRRVRSTQH